MRRSVRPSRSYHNRRQPRNEVAKKASFGQGLLEQFLTQFMICAFILSLIFAAQLLGIGNVNGRMAKIKSAITYSPSFNEMTQNAKEKSSALIQKLVSRDQAVNQEEIPKIIIDDEVF